MICQGLPRLHHHKSLAFLLNHTWYVCAFPLCLSTTHLFPSSGFMWRPQAVHTVSSVFHPLRSCTQPRRVSPSWLGCTFLVSLFQGWGLHHCVSRSCASLETQIVSKLAAPVCVPSSGRGQWAWLGRSFFDLCPFCGCAAAAHGWATHF